ncbi:MAG: nucleoside triphosphate pyrophosphohydrolase [Pseudomonadota bacterium]
MSENLGRLLEIMAALRNPDGGCPWDLEQDFHTIAPYTIEEAYEVADAIERRDLGDLKSELGDLLFQVVFHARMAEEAGAFAFDDVAGAIADKMVARHPHVFDAADGRSAEEQTIDWERMKAEERAARGATGVLDDVPVGLPALTRAVKLQKRAARVGFDWPDMSGVIEKIAEEARELGEAADGMAPEAIEEEFGDLMFAMANLARRLQVDPEKSLRAANAKFVRRFAHIEAALAAEGRSPTDSDLEEMDKLWDEAKAGERRPRP